MSESLVEALLTWSRDHRGYFEDKGARVDIRGDIAIGSAVAQMFSETFDCMVRVWDAGFVDIDSCDVANDEDVITRHWDMLSPELLIAELERLSAQF